MSNSAPNTRVSVLKALARIKQHAANEDEDDQPKPGAQAPPTKAEGDTPIEPDLRLDEPPSMDPDEVDDPDALVDVDVDGDEFTLDDVIKCFLRANPAPTAELMGLSYEEFEAEVFRKFGEVVRQATSLGPSEDDGEDAEEGEGDVEEDADDGVDDDDLDVDEDDQDEEDQELQADDELDVQDDIDMFVVAYILFNSEPSDEQIHQLAFVVGITKEQMEQRIYRMLGTFFQLGDEGNDEEDEDLDQDEDDEDGAGDTEDTDKGNEDDSDEGDIETDEGETK
jgi:hypothetical protein